MSRRNNDDMDEEAGVELQSDPTVRRARGRANPSSRRRGGERNSNSPGRRSLSPGANRGRQGRDEGSRGRSRQQRENSSSDDDDADDDDSDDEEQDDVDVEAPLMARGGGAGGSGGDKRSVKQSKLWQEDTSAQEKAAMARMSQLRPLGTPLKAKKYMFQQTIMRLLSSLIFAHVLVSFQVVCVFYTQCFDVADDPGNWHVWDNAAIPVMFIVGGMIIPFCLTLIEQKNLNMLKIGAAVQFLTSVTLSILCGLAYGLWDSENGLKGNIARNFEDNNYDEPYDATDNPIFSADDIFYYQLKKTGDILIDSHVLAVTLMEKMQWMFACNLIGGVLFLAQFR
ncbi:hypothetical protein TL16_g00742 [Triparma laevis f. inornata]|uniref:Transmembrane protein n=1 Tax=Triparma laevis f. inornata TaxID=1714386 RepID=A0A9W7DNL3_9STRA|nr:hypothetical protein TL16_g00742 [Triparma laevis f. inornata]